MFKSVYEHEMVYSKIECIAVIFDSEMDNMLNDELWAKITLSKNTFAPLSVDWPLIRELNILAVIFPISKSVQTELLMKHFDLDTPQEAEEKFQELLQ